MEVALEEAIQSLGEPPQEVVSTEDVHVKTECFICQKAIDSVQDSFELLQCETETSKTKLVEKMGQIVDQADVVIVVAEADTICRQCFGLLNTIDKLEGGLEKLKEEVRVHIVPRYKVQVPKPEPEEVEIRSGKKRVKRESGRATRNSPAKKTKNIRVAIKTATAKGKGAKQTNEPSVTITEEEIVEEEEDHAVETSTSEDPQPGPSTSTESTNRGPLRRTHAKGSFTVEITRERAGKRKGRKRTHVAMSEASSEDSLPPEFGVDTVMSSSGGEEDDQKPWPASRAPVSRPRREYTCKLCPQKFKTLVSLDRHQKSHEDGYKAYICEVCSKSFLNTRTLQIHSDQCKGNFTDICEFCGKGFVKRAIYIAHKRIHTGEKPFVCDKCGRRFTHSSSLQVHIHIHHTEGKRYACAACGRTYSTSSHLAAHRRAVHTEPASYQCSICGKCFSRMDYLNRHLIRHKGTPTLRCEMCPYRTIREKSLAEHMLEKHQMQPPTAASEDDDSRGSLNRIPPDMNKIDENQMPPGPPRWNEMPRVATETPSWPPAHPAIHSSWPNYQMY